MTTSAGTVSTAWWARWLPFLSANLAGYGSACPASRGVSMQTCCNVLILAEAVAICVQKLCGPPHWLHFICLGCLRSLCSRLHNRPTMLPMSSTSDPPSDLQGDNSFLVTGDVEARLDGSRLQLQNLCQDGIDSVHASLVCIVLHLLTFGC